MAGSTPPVSLALYHFVDAEVRDGDGGGGLLLLLWGERVKTMVIIFAVRTRAAKESRESIAARSIVETRLYIRNVTIHVADYIAERRRRRNAREVTAKK